MFAKYCIEHSSCINAFWSMLEWKLNPWAFNRYQMCGVYQWVAIEIVNFFLLQTNVCIFLKCHFAPVTCLNSLQRWDRIKAEFMSIPQIPDVCGYIILYYISPEKVNIMKVNLILYSLLCHKTLIYRTSMWWHISFIVCSCSLSLLCFTFHIQLHGEDKSYHTVAGKLLISVPTSYINTGGSCLSEIFWEHESLSGLSVIWLIRLL